MGKPGERGFSEGLKIAFDFVETVSQTQCIYREILYLVQPESEDELHIFVLYSLSQQGIWQVFSCLSPKPHKNNEIKDLERSQETVLRNLNHPSCYYNILLIDFEKKLIERYVLLTFNDYLWVFWHAILLFHKWYTKCASQ